MKEMKPLIVTAAVGGVVGIALSKVGMPGIKGASLGNAFLVGAAVAAVAFGAQSMIVPKLAAKK